jgi:hypothetical protein
MKWMKKPRPKSPNTMEGTPARFTTATRTQRASTLSGAAYSCR